MELQKLSSLKPVQPLSVNQAVASIDKPTATDFGKFLQEALEQVNTQQQEANVLKEKFVTGQLTDVHTLMIASEKASIGLQLTLQVRNKALEAYQEMMRMQV
jgi:flagellar hook-basal body complex protein FliE